MSQRSPSPRIRSPREKYRRSVSPISGRDRSYSPHSSVSSYYDRSLSRSPSRSRSRRHHMSRSPYRSSSRHGYRRYYSRSPSPRFHRSPPPHRRYRSRSPPHRRINRHINRECRVYVGNLPFEAKWHHLKDFMRQAGEVVYADVLFLPNGRSKGCGIVEYRYPEDAKHAIHSLHRIEFMGRPVFVREDRDYDAPPPPPPPPPKEKYEVPEGYRLFVGNLPYSASWQDMKDLFRKAGRVLHTDVNTEPGSRRSNGTGTVIFSDSRVARAAIDMFNGYEWKGNKLEVGEERMMPSKAPTRGTSIPPPASIPSTVPLPPSTAVSTPPMAAAEHSLHPHITEIKMESVPPSSQTIESPNADSHVTQYQQPQHHLSRQQHIPPPVIKPEYNANYEGMYKYGQDAAPPMIAHAPMYNISLVGGPGAHLPSQGRNQIFVNNLPFSTTWQDLIDLFRHVGPVVRSEILTMNGHPKGAGFVRFEDAATCEKAIGIYKKFNGYLYGGRHLDIKLDNRT